MPSGVTIILTLDVKPEAIEGLAAGFPAMFEDTVKRQGFRNIKVLRNGNKLTVVEEWDSTDDYDAYIAWRTERGDMDAIGSMVNGYERSDWPTLVARA